MCVRKERNIHVDITVKRENKPKGKINKSLLLRKIKKSFVIRDAMKKFKFRVFRDEQPTTTMLSQHIFLCKFALRD